MTNTEQKKIKAMEEYLSKAFKVKGTCKFVEGDDKKSKYKITDPLKGNYFITISLK